MRLLTLFVLLLLSSPALVSQSAIKPEALAHKTKGLELDRAGDLEGALREYAEAIRIQPDYALAFYNTGVVHARMGNYEEAISSYTRSIALDSQQHSPHYNLGTLLMNLRRFDEAIASLKKAKGLDNEDLPTRQNLGASYCSAGRHKEAVEEFEALLALNPDWNMARPCLIESLLRLGQSEKALATAKEYLRREPDDADGWGQAASILTGMGNWADAQQAFMTQATILRSNRDPRLGLALWKLAEAQEKNKNIAAARNTYRQSIKELSNHRRYANDLAAVESSYNEFLLRNRLESARPAAAPNTGTIPTSPATQVKTAVDRWQEADNKALQALYRSDFGSALAQANSNAELAQGFGGETDYYPRSLLRIAEVHGRSGNFREQEEALKQAVHEAEQRLGDRSDLTAYTNEQLAQFYLFQKNNNGTALPLFLRALAIRRKLAGDSDVNAVQTASFAAASLRALNRPSEAIALLEHVFKDRTIDNTPFSLVSGVEQLVLAYLQAGALEKAEANSRFALALMERQFGDTHPVLQSRIEQLAQILRKRGKLEEADTLSGRLATLKKP